jgi:hypothetical protein
VQNPGDKVLWELNSTRTAHLWTDSEEKGVKIMTTDDLTRSGKDLHMADTAMGEDQEVSSKGGRERVSFGTNMSTEEEESESGSGDHNESKLDTAMARFHAS